MTTERKIYTEEFKRDAVRLAKERGNSAQTARDLGISDNTLQGWKLLDGSIPRNGTCYGTVARVEVRKSRAGAIACHMSVKST